MIPVFFAYFALMSMAAAVLTVALRNPVHCGLALLALGALLYEAATGELAERLYAALKAGAADYIGKPWDDHKLLASVNNLLELVETRRELAARSG